MARIHLCHVTEFILVAQSTFYGFFDWLKTSLLLMINQVGLRSVCVWRYLILLKDITHFEILLRMWQRFNHLFVATWIGSVLLYFAGTRVFIVCTYDCLCITTLPYNSYLFLSSPLFFFYEIYCNPQSPPLVNRNLSLEQNCSCHSCNESVLSKDIISVLCKYIFQLSKLIYLYSLMSNSYAFK